MKPYSSILAGLLFGTLAVACQAEDKVRTEGAEVGEWTMDLAAATKVAEEKELPLLLNFTGSDWCGWCKLMDKNVFAQDEWMSYAAKNLLLVTIDFPQDESIVPKKYVDRNAQLAEQFGVRGYPTYLILESDGKTVLGQLGAAEDKTPESFISEVKDALKMSEANVAAYIAEHPDKADAFKAAIAEMEASKKALADWIATNPPRNPENEKLFSDFQDRIAAAATALGKF